MSSGGSASAHSAAAMAAKQVLCAARSAPAWSHHCAAAGTCSSRPAVRIEHLDPSSTKQQLLTGVFSDLVARAAAGADAEESCWEAVMADRPAAAAAAVAADVLPAAVDAWAERRAPRTSVYDPRYHADHLSVWSRRL